MSDLSKLDSLDWSTTMDSNPDSPTRIQSVLKTIADFATLSEILRTCGAMIIVASMSLFLIQGLEVAGDLHRYGTLLLQTILLAAGGFGLSYLLKENKGARVFYGLGLLSIPANFAVLGALVYSLVATPTVSYPAFAHWVVTDSTTTFIAAAAAIAVLLPLALFSLRIFARGSEATLTMALMGSCATLLIPVRDAIWVGPIALAGALAVICLIRTSARSNNLLDTTQGWFVKCVLFIPTLIILVRSVYLYQFNALIGLTIAATGFLLLRQVSLQLADSSATRKVLEFLSIPVAIVSSYFAGNLLDVYLNDSIVGIAASIIAASLVVEVSTRAGSSFMQRFLSVSAMSLLAIGLVLIDLFTHSLSTTILTALVLAIASTVSAMTRRRPEMMIGLISIAIVLTPQIVELIQAIQLNNWVTLSVIGAVAVVGGSLLDRHGASFKLRLENWFYRSGQVKPE